VPGLSSIPLLGTLFGVQSDGRNKSEVVLLITPRVVRSVGVPEVGLTILPGGTETDAGAPSVRINSQRPALTDPGLKAPPSGGGSNGS
jgi:general secretion pathway protein D